MLRTDTKQTCSLQIYWIAKAFSAYHYLELLARWVDGRLIGFEW